MTEESTSISLCAAAQVDDGIGRFNLGSANLALDGCTDSLGFVVGFRLETTIAVLSRGSNTLARCTRWSLSAECWVLLVSTS